jgi:hypothetical protein
VLRKTRFVPSGCILAQNPFADSRINFGVYLRQGLCGYFTLALIQLFGECLQSRSQAAAVAAISVLSPYALAVRLKRRRVIRHSYHSLTIVDNHQPLPGRSAKNLMLQ